jgi:hypothetical protein
MSLRYIVLQLFWRYNLWYVQFIIIIIIIIINVLSNLHVYCYVIGVYRDILFLSGKVSTA